eukprot:5299763-Pleurochrysis_carterae.AAC.1
MGEARRGRSRAEAVAGAARCTVWHGVTLPGREQRYLHSGMYMRYVPSSRTGEGCRETPRQNHDAYV